jgi:hypothetical protein
MPATRAPQVQMTPNHQNHRILATKQVQRDPQ